MRYYIIYAKVGEKVGKRMVYDKRWGKWNSKRYKSKTRAEAALRRLKAKYKNVKFQIRVSRG